MNTQILSQRKNKIKVNENEKHKKRNKDSSGYCNSNRCRIFRVHVRTVGGVI